MAFLPGFAALLFAAAQPGGDPEQRMEAAIHREVVLGDLPGAIEQYKAILALPAVSRRLQARSLLHIGLCMEKTGRRQDAHGFYARVVKEFGDLPEVSGQARTRLAGWESSVLGPRNLKFEEGVPGKVPPGWFVPALPKDADHLAELRRVGCHSGVGCAVVRIPPNAPSPVGNLMQSFSAAAYRGELVRLRAWLRLEPYQPELAERDNPVDWLLSLSSGGDRAQMWLSVDRVNRQRGFFDNMSDRPVRSAEWTRCDIVARIDEDATFINFGVMSIGRGRVWVDDVSFEIVSELDLR